MSASEETYTYKVFLGVETPYVGTSEGDLVDLEEFGFSDQEWDELNDHERNTYLDEWSEENFWNSGYGYWGEVRK